VVLDEALIGRLSFIGDSVLGESVQIGAGSMTVNRTIDWKPVSVKNGKNTVRTGLSKLGSFVGDGAIIGAGNTLPPGTVVASEKVLPDRYSISKR
jgi:bifunctional UDP-N-acetylglucosamine pyrophosphorylase/glucosamine-1-phosphate N-acetyltransferase